MEYRNVYPGVNLVFYGNGEEIEHDWVVAPGADPSAIRVTIDGAGHISLDKQGDLVLPSGVGTFRLRRPVAYQEIAGVRRAVDAEFALTATTLGFRMGTYDRTRPLVIDPTLSYSNLIGGSGRAAGPATYYDQGTGIAVDATGSAYVVGVTLSNDFPTANPLQPRPGGGGGDIFVLKLNPAGSAFVYATYLGGVEYDSRAGIAVDTSGNALITGESGRGFPVVAAFQPAIGGGSDVVVAKLNASGSALVYSTYLGGSLLDAPGGGEGASGAIAVDSSGYAYVTGRTASTNFPTTPGAFQATSPFTACVGVSGCPHAFVTKFGPTGNLVYSTYLGGSGGEHGSSIAVDSLNNAYVTGVTGNGIAGEPGFPVTPGAFQTVPPGQLCIYGGRCSNGFVTKLNPQGSALVYSTFLGGTTHNNGATAIAVDAAGNAFVTGDTSASDFPTTPGAFQTALQPQAGPTPFVTKLNPSGSALVYSTYLGKRGFGYAITVDAAGNAYVAGSTEATDFPVVNPIQLGNGAGRCTYFGVDCLDAFVTKLNPSGTALVYSTYFGGQGADQANGIAVDSVGNTYVVGTWNSGGGQWYPAVGPLQSPLPENFGGGAFVIKISESGSIPLFAPNGVTNGASFTQGLPFGGIVTIFGRGITDVNGIVTATSLPLPTELQGTSVTFGGVRVPLFAVANVNGQEQINLQLPYGVVPPVVVNLKGAHSVPVAAFALQVPGIFTVDGSTGAVQHASDYRPVTTANPAAKGEVVIIYATGLGDVQPRPAPGTPASASPLSTTLFTPMVTIGGIQAEVLFSGLAPGFVGLNQVNVRVPSTAPSGSVDLVLKLNPDGVIRSSNTVKLPVQ